MARGNRDVNVIINARDRTRGAFQSAASGLRGFGNLSKSEMAKFGNSISSADKVVLSLSNRLEFMDTIAKRTLQGTAAAAGVYATATAKSFAELDDGISKANTLFEHTASSRKQMMQEAIDMSRLLPGKGYSEITGSIYDTISSGADPENAARMTRLFGMASIGGDADMSSAVEAAMGTMNAFGMEAKDLQKILDLQFLTIKEGIVSYDELSQSFGTGVLSSAKDAGISIEELQASIAMLTKNAIPANIASTSLNQLFGKFTDPEVIGKFRDFNVEIQDANKHTRPFIDILKDLNKQFDNKGYTAEQRKGFLKGLVGDERTGRALAPLLNDMEEFDRILKEMKSPEGSLSHAYGARLESITQQFQLFWNDLKASGVEQLATFEPFIKKIFEPRVKRQKLEMELAGLDDQIHYEEDPQVRKQLVDYRIGLVEEIQGIETTPFKELEEAFESSLSSLKRLNPTLGEFVDIIGNFALSFGGEEGEENRKKAGNVGKGALGLYGVKKGIDVLGWIARMKILLGGGLGGAAAGKGVGAGVAGAAGAAAGAGAASAPAWALSGGASGVGAAVGGAIGSELLVLAGPIGLAIAAGMKERSKSKTREEVNKNPEYYQYSRGQERVVSKAEMREINEKQIELDRKNNVTFQAADSNTRAINKQGEVLSKLEERVINMPFKDTPLTGDLMDMHLKNAQIDNHVDLENQIDVDGPDVKVSVAIDGSNIPVQSVGVDFSKVQEKIRIQKSRRSNHGHHPDIY